MHNSIFSASYSETSKIVTRKKFRLNKAGFDNMKISKRIFPTFLTIFFVIPLFYGIGVWMPRAVSDLLGEEKRAFMLKYDAFSSGFMKFILIVWVVLSLLILIQRKNWGKYTFEAQIHFSVMIIAFNFIVFNLLFRISILGIGLQGTGIIVVCGMIYIFSTIFNLINEMKEKMYGIRKKHIAFKWLLLVTLISIGLVLINSLTSRPDDFNFVLYSSSFGLFLVFVVISLLTRFVIYYLILDFYFAKYGEQYKEKFKITDEQWYGPRKAKRLAKKKGK
ncbi:hypothetical protein GNF18_07195 [Ligilactobacillus pobuzihii]|uniref:hypothetical protein n=1 Tax=Ligilactobacillus pobuzihii TaxID=449659 RepID=UPI0019D0BDBF|nr:hypothetical protein [Ligilactobacillus pobuzihii]MBN7274920.1 hypothetical protein [Ligilactobacillus pobuzihii]